MSDKIFIDEDFDLQEPCANCGEVFDVHVIAAEPRTGEVDTSIDLSCGPWETAIAGVEKVLLEHPDKIYVWEYAHGNNEEFSEWEMWLDENTTYDKNGSVSSNLHYRLYEVDFLLEIDLRTGKDRAVIVRYGGQTFYTDDYDQETMKEFQWG